jgi:enoyl-CoA hydratase/carnithine racemase
VVRIPRRTHDPKRARVHYKNIQYEVDDHIATLTLHRPERMNAMNIPTIVEFLDAIDHVDADDDVRCVIVTGAGRAFCAGADLQDGRDTFASETWAEQPNIAPFRQRDGGGILALRIYRSPKPFIAAINGSAVGFGLTLTLPMDIRLCAEDAKLGFVFSRRGLVLDAAAGWFLPRIVSMTWATDWTYTGRLFAPAEAARAGLVRDVYPGDEVRGAALHLARQIAEANPVSVTCTKALLWRSASAATPWDAHRMDTAALKFMGPRDDTEEGVRAFMEKRAPQFTGRVSTDMPPGYLPWEEPEWEPLPKFGD